MVDPEASTRPEAPIGESDRHDAGSSVGPLTPKTPKTGDSSSEDELDYKDPGLEFKLYEEEFKKTAKEYAELRKEHAAIASGETPDDKIAQVKANIEKTERVLNECRVLMDEATARARTRTRKHKTRRGTGDTRSRVEGTRSANIPELGCALAAASVSTRQAWYWALLNAGKPVDERYLSY